MGTRLVRLLERASVAAGEARSARARRRAGKALGLAWVGRRERVSAAGLGEGEFIASDTFLVRVVGEPVGRSAHWYQVVRERVTRDRQDLGAVYAPEWAGRMKVGRVVELAGSVVTVEPLEGCDVWFGPEPPAPPPGWVDAVDLAAAVSAEGADGGGTTPAETPEAPGPRA